MPIDLTDTELNDSFGYTASFTLLERSKGYTLKIKEGETVVSSQTFYSNDSGNASDVTFTLKHGQKAVFENLPKASTYTVTEAAKSAYTPSYSGEGTGSAAENTSLTVPYAPFSAATDIVFTNTKTVEEYKRGTLKITVTKNWQKNDGTPLSSAELASADLPDTITVQVKQYEKVEVDGGGYEEREKSFVFSIVLVKTVIEGITQWIGEKDGIYKKSSSGFDYIYKIIEPTVQGFETISGATTVNDAVGNKVSLVDGNVVITNRQEPTYDFSLSKRVTGNMGNKAKKFSFSLVFTNPDKEVDGYYEIYDGSGNLLRTMSVNKGRTPNVALSSGETIIIKRLPVGTTVTAREIDGEDYVTTYSVNGGEARSGNTASVTMTDDNGAIKFTNTRSAVLPTLVKENPAATILIGLISLLAVFILKRKRKYA